MCSCGGQGNSVLGGRGSRSRRRIGLLFGDAPAAGDVPRQGQSRSAEEVARDLGDLRGIGLSPRPPQTAALEEGYKERACDMCGQGEIWPGRQLSLILDHVNGVRDDNRLDNLRILCPNCAATLDTHCGRKNRLALRRCRRCGREFQPASESQRYCSRDCGSRWDRTHLNAAAPETWLLGTESVAETWLARELSPSAAERTRFFLAQRAPFGSYGFEAMALILNAIAAGDGDRTATARAGRATRDRDSILGATRSTSKDTRPARPTGDSPCGTAS
jgi:hypothetical protein